MSSDELAVKAAEFEAFLDYRFRDRQLIYDALISKGYPSEHHEIVARYSQAVLANIGDTVIDVLVTEYLVLQRMIKHEGDLTKERNRMVEGRNLNSVAAPIMPFVLMTSGERHEMERSSIPGESLEGLVGALYLDGEMGPTRMLLEKLGLFD
jgi:dsRNA-specific ribonuclease